MRSGCAGRITNTLSELAKLRRRSGCFVLRAVSLKRCSPILRRTCQQRVQHFRCGLRVTPHVLSRLTRRCRMWRVGYPRVISGCCFAYRRVCPGRICRNRLVDQRLDLAPLFRAKPRAEVKRRRRIPRPELPTPTAGDVRCGPRNSLKMRRAKTKRINPPKPVFAGGCNRHLNRHLKDVNGASL
jgi:hypothetical protein